MTKIQQWHDSKKIKKALDAKAITLKDLRALAKKVRKHGDNDQAANLEK